MYKTETIGSKTLPGRNGQADDLRVSVSSTRKGDRLVDVRRWYRTMDGEVKPGFKGVSISLRDVPWLRSILGKVEAQGLAAGLLAEEDYELAGLPLPPEISGETRS